MNRITLPTIIFAAAIAGGLTIPVSASAGAPGSSDDVGQAASGSGLSVGPAVASVRTDRAPTAAERALRTYGYLVPNPAAYERVKQQATAQASGASAPAAADALAPVQLTNLQGIKDNTATPSDSTGAVGTSRYIELVNAKFGIYDRSNTLLSSDTLHNLVGASSVDNVFDPQVIWDPGTNRFYYAADQITSTGNNLLAIGFSKTATPSSAADFCKYSLNYGTTEFPDYPKLGDTKNFWVLGVNVFNGNSFTGSDIIAVTKPAAGSTCPAPASFGVTFKRDVKNANGTPAFTPVPANQTDTSGTGWVVARPASVPANFLTVFKITRDSTTGAAVIGNGMKVSVPSFSVPPSAPQKGATQLIDTSDTRNTQAVSAVDPLHGGKVGLWTQHTVAGGAGAEVRWYEIAPGTQTLFQSGVVTSASLYNFNGAISPDRKVQGTTKDYGGNMVMNFNTSSSTTFPAIKVVSKVGAGAQSAPTTVVTSAGPQIDFFCDGAGQLCRWGDYAAATPDPAAPTGALTGVVFGTSQYNKDGRLHPSGVNWLTRNFSFTP